MLRSIHPLHFLLTLLAGWINRRQLEVIEYLKEENRLLKERLGGRRLRFTDAERRGLARRAHALGRKALSELDTLVTPDTLMRWYRTLVAQKWTYTHRRGPGRPRTTQVIVQLIIRMAQENRSWGYTRIQGALANLGHDVSRGTIANVLAEHGIDPAPERGKRTSWSTFLKAHWDSIAATDFFTVEVLTLRGLVTYYVLFVLDLSSRKVKIAGITSRPDEVWMMQMVRNLTDAEGAVPQEHAVPDHGSRYEIFRSFPRGTDSGADRAGPTTAAITQFERVCGEIRTLSEDGVYRADGLLQQIIA